MKYNFEELQRVLDANPASTVMVGTQKDWGWTAETLDQHVIDAKLIAGIEGSHWDIPGYIIDGGEFTPCYTAD